VRFIFDRALDGVPLRRICELLAERGIPTPTGLPEWKASSIREILTKITYTGSVVSYATKRERLATGEKVRRPARDDERVVLAGIADPIVTDAEFAAVASRLERNKAQATRFNQHPERSLLRAGYIYCGHCGWALTVTNPTRASGSLSPQYRCAAGRHKGPDCPRPSITASMIDPIVWDTVSQILLTPERVVREFLRHRQDGGLERELAAVDTRLAALVAKRQKGTKRLLIVDDATAKTLAADLRALSEEVRVIEAERDSLRRRIADQEQGAQEAEMLDTLLDTLVANIDSLTYAEKRRTLDALGVKVRTYRIGTVDETGKPYPRWAITLEPTLPLPPSQSALLYGTSTGPARRSP
jgi:site-specific DNA recombinase